MTRKDYVKAAAILNKKWNPPKGTFPGVDYLYMIERSFIEFFQNDNPRFNVGIFIQEARKNSIEQGSFHPHINLSHDR
jgi:hypothetical protein